MSFSVERLRLGGRVAVLTGAGETRQFYRPRLCHWPGRRESESRRRGLEIGGGRYRCRRNKRAGWRGCCRRGGYRRPALQAPIDQWNKTLALNLTGAELLPGRGNDDVGTRWRQYRQLGVRRSLIARKQFATREKHDDN